MCYVFPFALATLKYPWILNYNKFSFKKKKKENSEDFSKYIVSDEQM